VPLWDGSRAVVSATKEIDLRSGSPAAAAMSEKQLAGARLHILSMAESKAKNRAIRSLGVRPAYSRAEAKLPFVCARAIFTGQTSDPELRHTFAVMQATAFLGAHTALYGRAPAAPQLPPARPAPLVGTVVDDDGVIDGEIEPESTPAPPPVHTAPAGSPAPEPAPSSPPPSDPAPVQQTTAAVRAAASGFAIPGGRSKGTPLAEADDRDLSYWGGRLEQEIADGTGKPQFRDRNEALARAIHAEQGRRAGGGGNDYGVSGGGDDVEGAGRGRGDNDDIPF
jgi:hypothetical protein